MACRSYIFLLLSSLCFFSVSAELLASIDCGSSALTYTDKNSIVWSGDDDFMQNGESQMVQTSNSVSHVMDTLRVFTSRKKNCYSIEVEKGVRVLVRASFHYGNYDSKSSPPSFDLLFDGNYWATVRTYNDRAVYYEVIYVLKEKYTSICLAQTNPNQFPLISALEVRKLGATMYDSVAANYALFLNRRIAYGANETIRYGDDIYDRIWNPMPGGQGEIPVSSDAPVIINDGDFPPKGVLQNAITASTTSPFIQLSTTGFPPSEVLAYVNLYFSEVIQLDSTQKRSFRLFKGNQSFSDPILPPYGRFRELSGNITVSSNTIFLLVPTPDSTLPPLINALEVFLIRDALTDGTNSRDLVGLASLQNAFDALQDWVGDPCLPAPYSWDWLNCSTDATPRITALCLSSFDLSGSLPDFSSMDSLETIYLQNNSLSGPIPDFLGTFPNLKELNLADNQFSGPIPASLSKKNGLKLVVTGNPLCSSGDSCQSARPSSRTSEDPSSRPIAGGVGKKKKKSSNLPIILGTTIPAFVLIWVVVGIFAIMQYNKRKTAAVVGASAGQNEAGNTSPMPLLNPEMMGKGGQVAMNEIKVDKNGQGVDQTAQQAGNGGRRDY